jgi:hypothetical protein
MKGPRAPSNESLGIGPQLSERELQARLDELLEEAREVGRAAGIAALNAGENLDTTARRPDSSRLLAALRRSLPGSSSAVPERSLTQRLDALECANKVRIQRAELKRDLKGGRISIDTLLLDTPDYIQTAKVSVMLLAVPGYGRVKVNKVLTRCRIAPSRTIGGLSQRQRDELVRLLRLG